MTIGSKVDVSMQQVEKPQRAPGALSKAYELASKTRLIRVLRALRACGASRFAAGAKVSDPRVTCRWFGTRGSNWFRCLRRCGIARDSETCRQISPASSQANRHRRTCTRHRYPPMRFPRRASTSGSPKKGDWLVLRLFGVLTRQWAGPTDLARRLNAVRG